MKHIKIQSEWQRTSKDCDQKTIKQQRDPETSLQNHIQHHLLPNASRCVMVRKDLKPVTENVYTCSLNDLYSELDFWILMGSNPCPDGENGITRSPPQHLVWRCVFSAG